MLGRAYRRRMLAEEQLLRRELPGYAGYAERTKRLIPAVW
jgi:protein-S-isoprenylcysteine O-methyltransferase Ste14